MSGTQRKTASETILEKQKENKNSPSQPPSSFSLFLLTVIMLLLPLLFPSYLLSLKSFFFCPAKISGNPSSSRKPFLAKWKEVMLTSPPRSRRLVPQRLTQTDYPQCKYFITRAPTTALALGLVYCVCACVCTRTCVCMHGHTCCGLIGPCQNPCIEALDPNVTSWR